MNIISSYKWYKWLIIYVIILIINILSVSILFSAPNNITESKKHYEKGVNLLNSNNIMGAIQEIEKSIEFYPDNQFAHFKLGLIYLEKTKAKFFYKAPEHFKKVIELVKDSADSYYIDSYYYAGVSYLQLGQYDEAISAFKEVLAIDSNYQESIKIHNFLGVAYYYKDNYEQAIPEFKTALQMDSHFKLANFNLKSVNMRLEHYNIGITYFFMKNFDEAIKEFSVAIEIDTNYFAAHMMLGETYLKKGIYNEAIREFQRSMMINPTHRDIPKILNKLGIVFYLQDKHKEAIFSLKKSLELDPENTEAIINLKNVYRNYKPAGIDKLDPEKDKDKYVKAHQELADDYYLINDYPNALKEFQKVFEADSGNDAVYKKLKTTYKKIVQYYFDEKKYDEAISVLKKILLIEPENETYWFFLGKAYFLKGKFWAKEAIEALLHAPGIKSSYYYLGKAYLEKGDTKEAIKNFELAFNKDEKNAQIPNELGNIYYKNGDYEKAVEWYKKACEIDINNAEYKKNLERAFHQMEVRTEKEGDKADQKNKEDSPQSLNREAIKAAKDGVFDNAQELIEKAIRAKSDSGILYNNLGNINFLNGVNDEALANYIMAETFSSDIPEITINLAIIYYIFKDFPSAEKNYNKAVKANKNFANRYKWLLNKGEGENPKIEVIWLELK